MDKRAVTVSSKALDCYLAATGNKGLNYWSSSAAQKSGARERCIPAGLLLGYIQKDFFETTGRNMNRIGKMIFGESISPGDTLELSLQSYDGEISDVHHGSKRMIPANLTNYTVLRDGDMVAQVNGVTDVRQLNFNMTHLMGFPNREFNPIYSTESDLLEKIFEMTYKRAIRSEQNHPAAFLLGLGGTVLSKLGKKVDSVVNHFSQNYAQFTDVDFSRPLRIYVEDPKKGLVEGSLDVLLRWTQDQEMEKGVFETTVALGRAGFTLDKDQSRNLLETVYGIKNAGLDTQVDL
jgi:hypothetical protein